jgi:hypothetical protein
MEHRKWNRKSGGKNDGAGLARIGRKQPGIIWNASSAKRPVHAANPDSTSGISFPDQAVYQ